MSEQLTLEEVLASSLPISSATQQTTPPIILDLFCGAGGASMGYYRAGFEVVGVDLAPQPHYPFTFVQADWQEPLAVLPGQWEREGRRYAIHASPPCQSYSTAVTSRSSRWVPTLGKDEPALIPAVREALDAIGAPYVIENVMGAREELRSPMMLCGTMFGLPISRHRLFETNWLLPDVPVHPKCRGIAKVYAAERGWDYRDMSVTGKGRRAGILTRWQEIMGIDWHMSQHQMAEAIPPAYTQWLATRLRPVLFASNRVLCECCGDWGCATHGGHIGERCDCWPCDDCRELVPADSLDDESLCPSCRTLSLDHRAPTMSAT